FVVGATGLQPQGPLATARVGIASTTYYALAQSPIWQTVEGVFFAFGADQQSARARAEALMPLPQAVALTRQAVAPGAVFASEQYPLVHASYKGAPSKGSPLPLLIPAAGPGPARRPNILLIFVEALDRRFTGPRLTP